MNELSIFSISNIDLIVEQFNDGSILYRFEVKSMDGTMQINLFLKRGTTGFFQELRERIKALPDSEEKQALEKLIEKK